jgi:hypothetical protein
MNMEKPKTVRRSWGRRVLAYAGWGGLGVVALCVASGWIWHFSGSNHWELNRQNATTKVYTLKSPGSDRMLFKAQYRSRASLSQIVVAFKDMGMCDLLGCQAHVIDRVDDDLSYVYMKLPAYAPFKPRDFVLRVLTHQNPLTKEVMIEVAAVQDRVPLNDCCVRVVEMNNLWKLTPVGNGMVDVEVIINADVGGNLPDLVTNLTLPRALAGISGFQRLYNTKRFREARLAYIQEPEDHT